MAEHSDFHTMPSMSRRAFLAGLMALPAAAAVPGLGSHKMYFYETDAFTIDYQPGDLIVMYSSRNQTYWRVVA